MQISEIEEELVSLSGNNVEFYNNIIPNSKPCMGVRVPELRKIAKRIAKENYKEFIKNNPLDTYEMEALQAFVLGYAKDDIQTLLLYVKNFIPQIHDWAVNDALCQTFKIARKNQEQVFDFLMQYKHSQKEFEVRVVAVMLMSHFINDNYVDKVIEVLNTLCTNEYYAKMGVAWAVAEVMTKYPEKCMNYLKAENNNLDNWTYNKAIQKMKESFRVSDETKKIITQLKRK